MIIEQDPLEPAAVIMNGLRRGLPSFDRIGKGKGIIAGFSGLSNFRYEISDRLISLIDVDNENLEFQAAVGNLLNDITFNIHTKGFRGNPNQKHPDLYGMRLAVAAYQYFWSQGIQIDQFVAVWAEGESPENLEAYYRKFGKLQPYYQHGFVTEEECEQIAIRNTFSYRLAVNLGFPQIRGTTHRYQGIRDVMSIYFTRPNGVKIINPFAKKQDEMPTGRIESAWAQYQGWGG